MKKSTAIKPKMKKPLVIQAYELLKEKIITLQFGPGMKLEEQKLVENLSLGRTPIREAVKMLISEGLIVSYGSNSTYVKDLTLKSARDLFALLYRLGDVIFDLVDFANDFTEVLDEVERLYPQMDDAVIRGDVPAFAQLNAAFHKQLARVAGNEYIESLLERLYCEEVRLAYILSLSLGAAKGTPFLIYYQTLQRQHHDFIEQLRSKDIVGLKNTYRDHLAFGQKRLLAYFAEDLEHRKRIFSGGIDR